MASFPKSLENGAKCVFEYVLQRPVFEGLMRMVVENKVDWSRKARRIRRRVGRKRRDLERGESLGDL